jgi:hypothetical protein
MLITLVILLIVFSAMSFFYWMIVQPVLLRRYVYRMFALRDALRWELIEGNLDKNDKHVHTLEHIIGAIIANASEVSLSHFLLFCLKTRNVETPKEIKSYQCEAPELVKNLNRSAMDVSFDIMLINSPLLVSFSAIGAVVVAIYKLSIVAPRQKAKEFFASKSDNAYVFISEMPVQVSA